ncbi:phenazine antibiotic biosynthesis protein [Nocardia sp. NPDC051929]|uniref:phenazine antibiotic biosynthesis protein n=1 Tax=unclassified Nocardia TaxID=2637762 RepID=UPI00343EAD4C
MRTDTSGIDADDYVRALMQWHFHPRTGSPFWLRRAAQLDFDPLIDIEGTSDLARFPNVVNDLRTCAVEDLIPRGLGSNPGIAGVFESGGTTGTPKRLVFYDEWIDTYVAWEDWTYELAAAGPVNILAVVPSGPHMLGELATRQARRSGGMKFSVDLDPRWVKSLISQGKIAEADAYVTHLIDQAAAILRTQRVDLLVITPPLLERMVRQDELVELINRSVRKIHWGGAHMDADSRHLYRTEIFPEIIFRAAYGSTTILGGARERVDEDFDSSPIFDSFSPYAFFRVVDPNTGADVEFGERGQVVMNYLTKYAFLPNNLERDMGYRVPAPAGAVGSSVADVAPVASFAGHQVIEGVY